MSIDIEKAKKVFYNYVEKYDLTNSKIKLKVEHIYKVAENSKMIAQNLKLKEEDVKLAELIGLLHDIGRFEQILKYNTFADRNSEDHAELGIKVLLENNFIDQFVTDKKEQEILIKAIKNHNKYKMQEGLDQREALHSKIIRDADKLDIYRIIVGAELKDAVWFKSADMSAEILNTDLYEDFMKEELVSYKNMKNCVDQIVVWVAFIYDLNFPISLKIVKENEYTNRLIDRLDYKDELTKKRMEEIRQKANEYLEKNR